jgi:hypothetical protein
LLVISTETFCLLIKLLYDIIVTAVSGNTFWTASSYHYLGAFCEETREAKTESNRYASLNDGDTF